MREEDQKEFVAQVEHLDLYEERRRLGAQTESLPLKFGMNAIPGKLAQKAGTRPWYDLPLAGLVNSPTRAQLIEAIGAVGQRETVMLMTDCIYATRVLPLPTGLPAPRRGSPHEPLAVNRCKICQHL